MHDLVYDYSIKSEYGGVASYLYIGISSYTMTGVSILERNWAWKRGLQAWLLPESIFLRILSLSVPGIDSASDSAAAAAVADAAKVNDAVPKMPEM